MNVQKKMNKYLMNCPVWIIIKSVKFFDSIFDKIDRYGIKRDYENDPETWWAEQHFYWGMDMRNLLRKNVCLDNELPTGNWDDYYVQMIELTVGVREIEINGKKIDIYDR
jgi:uncharacterized LabA/DUF88 family protein